MAYRFVLLFGEAYPFQYANIILPTWPTPSFNIQVNVADKLVAVLEPTPSPFKIECVVSVPTLQYLERKKTRKEKEKSIE